MTTLPINVDSMVYVFDSGGGYRLAVATSADAWRFVARAFMHAAEMFEVGA